MMPMGIASFSFDLFGLSRREPVEGHKTVEAGHSAVTSDTKAPQKTEPRDEPEHRDHEHVFWGMFPVL